ncbi:MAG TPA: IS481 family transposase [Thermomicrobiaceae bacterium]|jgi:transposase InsO family protein|nr:IS481 family transposase [Thermomicrobiaceae bacterium]
MAWQERTRMSERQEFVAFARQDGANIAALCRRFGISRKTGYKWLGRAAAAQPLADRSRRPCSSPTQTPPAMEERILALRAEHPAWGGRKLHHALARESVVQPPAPSTITAILRRHGQLAADAPPRDFVRFEHPAPNDLWQLDFMGHRALDADRVHPLTLLDDHSRFALALAACGDEQLATVKAQVTAVFRRYGLPRIILTDNGAPWAPAGEATGLTRLEAWWLQLGIAPWHGAPAHPQTQGKVERFHGTIAAEVFGPRPFPDLAAAQTAFDAFRATYNHTRPHEALGYAVPADRYQPSPRPFPETLPEIVYGPDDEVRVVTVHGSIQWQGRRAFVSRGLVGLPVGVRPTDADGVWHVYFCHRQVATIARR